ncbi:MAG: AAA family ATPase, partial [Cytophagales bacterium]|nr:AAA family ATPase [Cytophagales bacterium]
MKDIIIENVGPIGRLDVELGFDESQNPKPVIFVGENGSGKTIVLSHIVDALVEFAKQSFRDVMHSSQSLPNPYFKITGVTNVKMKSSYGIAFLNFVDS